MTALGLKLWGQLVVQGLMIWEVAWVALAQARHWDQELGVAALEVVGQGLEEVEVALMGLMLAQGKPCSDEKSTRRGQSRWQPLVDTRWLPSVLDFLVI